MENDLVETYTLIHSFLLKQSHTKVAQALRKAVKEVVILKDGVDIDGPNLEDIIKEWKALRPSKAAESSDSSSDSDDSDSSDSDSSDASEADPITKRGKVVKKAPTPPPPPLTKKASAKKAAAAKKSSSSSSVSSSSEDKVELAIGKKAKVAERVPSQPTAKVKPSAKRATVAKKSSSPSSSSSSSSESEVEPEKLAAETTKKLAVTVTRKGSTAADSPGSVSSGSSSDSDEDSTDSGAKTPQAQKKLPSKNASPSGSDSESDDESSDSGSKVRIRMAPKAGHIGKKQAPIERMSSATLSSVGVPESSSSSSSDSSSDSSEEDTSSSEPEAIATIVKGVAKEMAEAADKPLSESEESSEESSEDSSDDKAKTAQTVTVSGEASTSSSSSSDSSDSDAESKTKAAPKDHIVTKKRRTSASGAAIATATIEAAREDEPDLPPMNRVRDTKGKLSRKIGQPFRRVDPEKVASHIVTDNRYEAKAGPSNDYGHRAHADLIVTRGAGFRKEKNKKKRGSYRGGEITMESHSFKFA